MPGQDGNAQPLELRLQLRREAGGGQVADKSGPLERVHFTMTLCRAPRCCLEQQTPNIPQLLAQVAHEPGAECAVDDAMVIGQRQR